MFKFHKWRTPSRINISPRKNLDTHLLVGIPNTKQDLYTPRASCKRNRHQRYKKTKSEILPRHRACRPRRHSRPHTQLTTYQKRPWYRKWDLRTRSTSVVYAPLSPRKTLDTPFLKHHRSTESFIHQTRPAQEMPMSHVTYEWVLLHMNESCHIHQTRPAQEIGYQSCISEWVMSHTNESCYIWMSHVTYIKQDLHKRSVSVMYFRMSHVTYEWVLLHMNESCHIHQTRPAQEIGISPVFQNESCHIRMSHDTYSKQDFAKRSVWVMSFKKICISHVYKPVVAEETQHPILKV